jgi:hypothetical protein
MGRFGAWYGMGMEFAMDLTCIMAKIFYSQPSAVHDPWRDGGL